MATGKIARAIKDSCKNDDVMKEMLLELLDFNMTGRSWYKEEYKAIVEKYADLEAEVNED